jgi:hypothetical protein
MGIAKGINANDVGIPDFSEELGDYLIEMVFTDFHAFGSLNALDSDFFVPLLRSDLQGLIGLLNQALGGGVMDRH